MNKHKKVKVGIFPCGSEVGLEICRALKYSIHFEIIGLNSIPDYGEVAFNKYIGNLPFYKDKNFIKTLKKVIIENNLYFIIPAMDEIGYQLKLHEDELDCEVVYNNIDAASIIRKKSLTYKKFQNLIPTPKMYSEIETIESFDFPLFSKPDIGYGSRNVIKIDNFKDLELAKSKYPNNLILEYLPGKEYTIDCFSNMENEVIYTGVRSRDRIRMGISVRSESFIIPEINEIAKIISHTLKLNGVWFFQVKISKNQEYKLLEIASRVSGSMSLNRIIGINFILMDLHQRLGNKIKILPNNFKTPVILERAFNCHVILNNSFKSVFVDFDDCIIINDKINTSLISFIYQAINNNCKIVLITRHRGNLKLALEKYRIGDLFDEIHHIRDNNTPKSKFINEEKAIFIDDSFKERYEVATKKDIMTFAPDSIPAIINKNDYE